MTKPKRPLSDLKIHEAQPKPATVLKPETAPLARINKALVRLGYPADSLPMSYALKPDKTLVFIAPDGKKFFILPGVQDPE